MPSCPTCGKNFDKQKSLNKHHYPAHGFSIAKEDTNCVECGDFFEYYPSEKQGLYCGSCVEANKENLVHESGKDNTNWKGGSAPSSCENCCNFLTVSRGKYKEEGNYVCSDVCQSEYLSESFSGKGNPRYIDGKHRQRNYGTGWREAKKKALKRDGCECIVCGRGEEELSRKPSVHHKIPVRTFDDATNAHYLDNLVCLCPKHHQEVEAGNRKI